MKWDYRDLMQRKSFLDHVSKFPHKLLRLTSLHFHILPWVKFSYFTMCKNFIFYHFTKMSIEKTFWCVYVFVSICMYICTDGIYMHMFIHICECVHLIVCVYKYMCAYMYKWDAYVYIVICKLECVKMFDSHMHIKWGR